MTIITKLANVWRKIESGTWWLICAATAGFMYLSMVLVALVATSPIALIIGAAAMVAFRVSVTVGVLVSLFLALFTGVLIKHVVVFFRKPLNDKQEVTS